MRDEYEQKSCILGLAPILMTQAARLSALHRKSHQSDCWRVAAAPLPQDKIAGSFVSEAINHSHSMHPLHFFRGASMPADGQTLSGLGNFDVCIPGGCLAHPI